VWRFRQRAALGRRVDQGRRQWSFLSRAEAIKVSFDFREANYDRFRPIDIAEVVMTELKYWNGAVVRLGREVVVPTPTASKACAVPASE
jgi:hypothetical protein